MKFVGLAAVCLSLVQISQAAQIGGTIGFTGRVQLNTGTASTASQVVSWINPTVNGTSGAFTSVANGTGVTIVSPWNFNMAGPTIVAFWKVGGFTFDLTSSSIVGQGGVAGASGFVNVSGIGTVYGNGYDRTTIIWNFSSQDPRIIGNPDSFTFSVSQVATPSVPDGGATVALLGIALTGAGLLRKKFMAA